MLLPKSLANGSRESALSLEDAKTEAERLAGELRAVSSKVEDKLKGVWNVPNLY
jgi:hypothetical protein